MCKEMVEEDYKIASRVVLLKENKLDLPNSIQDWDFKWKKYL